ncbi:MAG TPA: hypothetical protein VEA99_13855 [Gemmatimonadaceae bacterium]|nr:hypothetical protein [Gemmatimonadaceae bacterium]
MSLPIRGRAAALALIMTAVAACGPDETERVDADLQRDLELANRAQQAPVVFQDTALGAAPAPAPAAPRPEPAPAARQAERRPTPTPRRPPTRVAARPVTRPSAPRPEPEPATREPVAEAPAPAPAPGPARGSIGAGTTLALASNARVCTATNRPGDKITATVGSEVRGVNGAVIPAGSTVVLEVADVETADPVEQSRVRFRVRAIDVNGESYPVVGGGATTASAEKVDYGRSKAGDQKKVIGGAVAGAILGQVLGKDTRSTIIGAAAGAAAGTAAAKMGGKSEGCFPAGTPVRVTLEESIVMRA